MTEPMLTTAKVAEQLGIKPATWRSLVAQGYAPKADDPDADAPEGERRPKWKLSTVTAFQVARKGRGRHARDDAGRFVGGAS